MTKTHSEKPASFLGARWRFAREKTGRRLTPALNAFFSSWIGLTLPLVLGALIFGAAYVYAQWQAYVAGLFALLSVLALALVGGAAIFLFYLLTAPAAIWRRDQETIADLQSSLVPALRLEFDKDECIKLLRRGSITHSVSGERWYDVAGADRHILIKCTNASQVRIDSVEVRVVGLTVPPGDKPGPGFFEPVRLRPPSRGPAIRNVDLPPGNSRFFSVVTQVSEYSRPWFSGEGQPLDYEFLFDRSGTYEIRIEAHGQGTTNVPIALELVLERRDKADATKSRYTEYQILSVQQKDVAER